MNTETGKITELAVNERLVNGKMTELTPDEYQFIVKFPEAQRPQELALLRFKARRKELGRHVNYEESNAFRLGYNAAIADRKL